MKNIIWIWFSRKLYLVWYSKSIFSWLLLPISYCFWILAKLRKLGYLLGIFRTYNAPVPVIVVGNITVGGTGKTPLVVWLAQLLKEKGWRPGVVCSGYGGYSKKWPTRVSSDTSLEAVGDEAFLLFEKVVCPVVAGSRRSDCVEMLVNEYSVDVVVSDDGLQHYALERDIEIAVIDGSRRFGNERLLPAGPLREAKKRLDYVDFTVVKGCVSEHETGMLFEPTNLANLLHPFNQATLESFKGMTVNAVAGVGNNESFFKLLLKRGINCIPREFPDHYIYSATDLDFSDNLPIIMTEKDAVKCKAFAKENWWFLSIRATLPDEFEVQFLKKLSRYRNEQKTSRTTGLSSN